MTREEIIKGLKFTIEMFLINPNTGETRTKEGLNDLDKTTVEACEGAIELLEQESCDDAISRKAVQDLFSTDLDKRDRQVSYQAMCVNTIFSLEDLPSVTPIRPEGKWIENREERGCWNCSVCEKLSDWKEKFCPNRGADMREE